MMVTIAAGHLWDYIEGLGLNAPSLRDGDSYLDAVDTTFHPWPTPRLIDISAERCLGVSLDSWRDSSGGPLVTIWRSGDRAEVEMVRDTPQGSRAIRVPSDVLVTLEVPE